MNKETGKVVDTVFQTERAWIEINTKNLRHNVETLKKAMPPKCELMAVVKAQAYGHGAALIAAQLNKAGVTAFAVATIDEGIKLREHGICGDILILGYTNVNRAIQLKEYDLTQTLISFEYAKALNEQGIVVKSHIKIDTGMHRLGISSEDFSSAQKVLCMEHLSVCGIFTHLCCADSKPPSCDSVSDRDMNMDMRTVQDKGLYHKSLEDSIFTRAQIGRFYGLINNLKKSGVNIPKLHIQSSYGFLNYPDLSCDYVRVGIALYGVLSSPGDDTICRLDLRPVFSLKSRVVLIRSVGKGDSVGYGRSFIARRDTRIAILPIGYADGFPGSLSDGKGSVLINQHIAPVIGRICMDQLAVDITDVEGVSTGDIATLAGAEGYEELSVPVVAKKAGSISNELLCRMGVRLPVVEI